jgi:glycosyltransferase involved in cell wall biosynthesis
MRAAAPTGTRRDLASIDAASISSFVLRSDGDTLKVEEFHRGQFLRALRFPLMAPVREAGVDPDPRYAAALSTVCWALRINLIHVHHLKQHAFDLAAVAAAQSIPYVVTLHDYYMLCPSYTLLTPQGGCVMSARPAGWVGKRTAAWRALANPVAHWRGTSGAAKPSCAGLGRFSFPVRRSCR